MYIYILGEDKPESSIFSHDFIKETPVVGSIYKNLSTYIRLRNWRAAKFQNYYQLPKWSFLRDLKFLG